MKAARRLGVLALCLLAAACADRAPGRGGAREAAVAPAQTPSWSAEDRQFFLHGSMSAEMARERVSGVWARSPYLHNGSVRTLDELLGPAAARAATFGRGSRVFDEARVGFADEGPYLLDTRRPGSSNAGHEYGAALEAADRRDLLEYLKSL